MFRNRNLSSSLARWYKGKHLSHLFLTKHISSSLDSFIPKKKKNNNIFSVWTLELVANGGFFFSCLWQRLPVWSRWAWSRERFPRSRSPPPPSTTPTGRLSARVSTTRRTAGRPRTTPSGSGYRSVTSLEVGGRTEVMSHWFLFGSLISGL